MCACFCRTERAIVLAAARLFYDLLRISINFNSDGEVSCRISIFKLLKFS